MLFIKNLTKLSGSEIGLTMTTGNEISVELKIADAEPVTLAKSKVQDILVNLKKSFEYIGTTTNHLDKTENVTTTELMSNKITELGFFAKGIKTVFTEATSFPVTIGEYDKEAMGDKHFPRDMILFILPNGENDDYKLVIDERNLGAATIVKNVGEYRLIGVFSKWPIWSKLRFPAYMYIQGGDSAVVSAFKLGSKTDKKLTKNCLIEVTIQEAVDYLDESFRIMNERRSQNSSGVDRRNKASYNKPNQTSDKKFEKNPDSSNRGRAGVPSKFKNGNSTRLSNKNKNRR